MGLAAAAVRLCALRRSFSPSLLQFRKVTIPWRSWAQGINASIQTIHLGL